MKFLLDSGDPDEYREIASLAKQKGGELWGATTNPTLIAKKLTAHSGNASGQGQKIKRDEAFALQKKIVLEILEIVPGAVSAEVYADANTTAEEMVEQGRTIATWHERVVVKLPTTIEGLRARTELRKANVVTNNTLVFSQEQIFAICLHEQIIQSEFSLSDPAWPPFISPFVGRLDDIGQQGIDLIANGMKIKKLLKPTLWMLEASVRSVQHITEGEELGSELITAPGKVYKEFFQGTTAPDKSASQLSPIPYWEPSEELLSINSVDAFMEAITSGDLDIHHELTDKGIFRFAQDWNTLIVN